MKKLVFLLLLGAAVSAAVVFLPHAVRRAPITPPTCCVEDMPSAARAAAALPARSLYQADLRWTDDSGRPFQLAALRGRPVVLAMFFAHCDNSCPIIVADLMRLRETLPAVVRAQTRFVLVSFDSTRDTPEALRAYREQMRLEAGDWTLLHGEPANVEDLAMLLGVKFRPDPLGGFAHSNLVTVLGADGEIVHQRAGLGSDLAETARAIEQSANIKPAP